MGLMAIETTHGEYLPAPGELSPTDPWLQRHDESSLWYDRFAYYYLVQCKPRSILDAYKRHLIDKGELEEAEKGTITNAPRIWYDNAELYNWKERANAKDSIDLQEWMDNLDQLREEAKRERIEAYRLTLNKTTEAIALKEVGEMAEEGIAALSNAQKNSSRELRTELEGSTPHTQVNVLIADLSPELRQALSETIKRNT